MEAEAARVAAKAVRKRRLPKGTSEYQAAWILDDDDGRWAGGRAGGRGWVDGCVCMQSRAGRGTWQ